MRKQKLNGRTKDLMRHAAAAYRQFMNINNDTNPVRSTKDQYRDLKMWAGILLDLQTELGCDLVDEGTLRFWVSYDGLESDDDR